ncbi:MAG: 30S ribosomal protein S4 [Candidatus Azambacteria bacterium GW2011_GWE1_42_9]|nr:MAG: 30S ribosomal protein S4 [Candidatus Azambacteria bacterium GW2011_GWF1_41_10]KKS49129.1 MAG: 30S ribosomal protein S4 [Candidatus Azambacteria bacterium GW2011_GWF2_42_22]KKS69836.1 MAG: 30S ribosomal protein S4 [Candidatus Azambacteria bacterium GW2011_GWA2_42_62]KKS79286.1 MAG: 30S ribosomal protein S4 [Candidatus Azambacteria bacterium GW2011_GWE1_42_9]KKT03291.1 MAG: 30S ribosomal protein S4 [Candidatus Azambacteria bacterium GW2011_GWD1_43_18]KKT12632.1 MAG: 30S ribosomal protein
MRYTGPKEKLSRKVGENLGLKAERSFSPKSAFLRKPYKPGVHGKLKGRRRAMSEFGTQLLEKQKLKYTYGITEKQLRKYFREIKKKKGIAGELLLRALEKRLDNVVYRSGFALSRGIARQVVSHGHFLVNNKRITIPSYSTKSGDIITIRSQSRPKAIFLELANKLKKYDAPVWLSVDKKNFELTVKAMPPVEDLPKNFDINAIIAFYSR